MKPLVSVVVASRNCPQYIGEALESIRSQTLKNFEVLIVDESTDKKTRKIIAQFAKKDKRFKPFYESGIGLSGSINLGLKKSQGEFIARMDADDVCLPERLVKQVAYMRKHPKIDLIGGWAILINSKGKKIGEITTPPPDDATFRRRMIVTGPWVSPTLMFRRKMLRKTGLFDPSFRFAEDYEFVSRALPHIKVANMQEFLLKYRWDFTQNLTFTSGKKTEWNALRVRWRMIKHHTVPAWYVIYLVKPSISYLIPTALKKWIITRSGIVPKHG